MQDHSFLYTRTPLFIYNWYIRGGHAYMRVHGGLVYKGGGLVYMKGGALVYKGGGSCI